MRMSAVSCSRVCGYIGVPFLKFVEHWCSFTSNNNSRRFITLLYILNLTELLLSRLPVSRWRYVPKFQLQVWVLTLATVVARIIGLGFFDFLHLLMHPLMLQLK